MVSKIHDSDILSRKRKDLLCEAVRSAQQPLVGDDRRSARRFRLCHEEHRGHPREAVRNSLVPANHPDVGRIPHHGSSAHILAWSRLVVQNLFLFAFRTWSWLWVVLGTKLENRMPAGGHAKDDTQKK